jgi:CrcB protein
MESRRWGSPLRKPENHGAECTVNGPYWDLTLPVRISRRLPLNGETEAIDPDVDLHVPAQRRELSASRLPVLAAVAVGGGIGSMARYGLLLVLPTMHGQFPWGTFAINVVGCALIGVLMVLISEVWSAHRLLRPLLGVGVLGGFTTFSTYAVEVQGLLDPGSLPTALAYLAGTPVCALLAVLAAVWLTRWGTGVAGRGAR